ncbi:MAG: PTS fructose transporter subunit EIIC [Longibaculum muris]|uniref:PTS system IIC component (Fru family) n=1 Tax=Longibaculum muris TaxID=1796628 RepID=A0A4R3YGQ4_9FIRM|nr:PTS fructose transporter subunit EIIC [Longibaculum muris]MCR1887618.1 PTS fructose transporter subunit EIIC [Longibaculum muris]MED9812101.1 PTS fructose transporter subunit EIIC [Longibaculum muris]TCV91132.1 PTS system IIC component (Fru family) [Longibaculum muris]
MRENLKIVKRHLLTGTSHMIPFIVSGGILLALSVMVNPQGISQSTVNNQIFVSGLSEIGHAGLTLFIPVLGGYIAYSIAERPGLAPGMCGAWVAKSVGAGFLGGIAAGFIAGVIVNYLKKIELPLSLKSLGAIFLYPVVGTLLTGGIVFWLIGKPISFVMSSLTSWLAHMNDIGLVPLGAILGSMTAFDMGGPINKVATLFAQTQVDTLPYLMGGVGVAICTPSIGMGIATMLAPKKYNVEEREAGKAAILMGCMGITEGAIPFAANDPIRVIPSICVGAAIGNIISFLLGVLNHAPWGGLIVLPVIEGKLGYVIGVVVGSLVTAILVNVLKRKNTDHIDSQELDCLEDIELDFEEL